MQYMSWVPGNVACNVGHCLSPAANLTSDSMVDDCLQSACKNRDLFYSDPSARGLYRDHIRAVLTRVNSFTGQPYYNSPAIFAWVSRRPNPHKPMWNLSSSPAGTCTPRPNAGILPRRSWCPPAPPGAQDLMNEPNCREDICTAGTGLSCAQRVQQWIGEMSAFVKSVDPNHMVTVGEDGEPPAPRESKAACFCS